jgi:restriction system protein
MEMAEMWQQAVLAMGFVFPAWPLVLLGAVARGRRRARWGLAALGWLLMLAAGLGYWLGETGTGSWLIPEPWNTLLFWGAGAGLFGAPLGRQAWARWRIWAKARAAGRVEDLRRLTPREFEALVVAYYEALGHKARHSGGSGDHGMDVVVETAEGEKWIVQCKRWRGTVGEPAVRDLYGVMHHEEAARGVIVTTGRFSEQARDWVVGKPIELVEGEEFMRRLKRVGPRPGKRLVGWRREVEGVQRG